MKSGSGGRFPWLLAAGMALTLLLLLAHGLSYRFLTDDAYISFRYARNLAEGYGLVFNPGGEAVEGYTNFLWVLLIAAGYRAGLAPEAVSLTLGLLATAGLWAVLAWYLRRATRSAGVWPTLLPLLLLALTRSTAVWTTSGLETRLFGLLVIGGVLRALFETEQLLGGGEAGPPRPWSAALFALASLTRPTGLLVAGCVGGTMLLLLALRRRLRPTVALSWVLTFGLPVATHFLFRRWYYGDWLPNTFYAKVNPGGWWEMGLLYLAAAAIEYGAWCWLPLIAVGVIRDLREGRAFRPLIIAAALLPHALYLARIGGDHFEYRPLEIHFPLLYVGLGLGIAALPRSRPARVAAAACCVLAAALVVDLPLRSRLEAPRRYVSGFPGADWALDAGGRDYLDPSRDPLYRWPPLRPLARFHKSSLQALSRRFIGIRQEEHSRFLEVVRPYGLKLGDLVRDGRLPADLYVAIDSVGAIPYFSGLRTLDRLGLTDRHVARSGRRHDGGRAMAHDRYADPRYAWRRGVDVWAVDNVRPIIHRDDPVLAPVLERAASSRAPIYWADLGDGYMLLALFPQGIDKARDRLPALDLRPVRDRAALARFLGR